MEILFEVRDVPAHRRLCDVQFVSRRRETLRTRRRFEHRERVEQRQVLFESHERLPQSTCVNAVHAATRTVAIGGLGAIGLSVARALDAGDYGLTLVAVSASNAASARAKIA